jgi:hypothetical protein
MYVKHVEGSKHRARRRQVGNIIGKRSVPPPPDSVFGLQQVCTSVTDSMVETLTVARLVKKYTAF